MHGLGTARRRSSARHVPFKASRLYFAGACTHKTRDVSFSNRPFGVKRFQTIHHHSVDVAHGLVLLFGIGAKALPVWDSKTRRNNLSGGLAVSRRQNQADMRTHLPSSREGHLPLLGGARVSSYRIDFMD